MGIDSCVDRFTQIINDVFDSIAVKEIITAATKPLELKAKYCLMKNVDTYILTIVMSYEHTIKIGIRTIGNF